MIHRIEIRNPSWSLHHSEVVLFKVSVSELRGLCSCIIMLECQTLVSLKKTGQSLAEWQFWRKLWRLLLCCVNHLEYGRRQVPEYVYRINHPTTSMMVIPWQCVQQWFLEDVIGHLVCQSKPFQLPCQQNRASSLNSTESYCLGRQYRLNCAQSSLLRCRCVRIGLV